MALASAVRQRARGGHKGREDRLCYATFLAGEAIDPYGNVAERPSGGEFHWLAVAD